MPRRLLAALLTAFAFLSPPLAAQRLPAPVFVHAAPAEPPRSTPVYTSDDFDGTKAAFAGILGTVTGYVAGGLIGHQFDPRPCDDCFELGLLGAFVGATVGTPVAVHLSNNRQGRLAPSVFASSAIGLGAIGAAAALHDGHILLAIPILQIASAVTIERRTARD